MSQRRINIPLLPLTCPPDRPPPGALRRGQGQGKREKGRRRDKESERSGMRQRKREVGGGEDGGGIKEGGESRMERE